MKHKKNKNDCHVKPGGGNGRKETGGEGWFMQSIIWNFPQLCNPLWRYPQDVAMCQLEQRDARLPCQLVCGRWPVIFSARMFDSPLLLEVTCPLLDVYRGLYLYLFVLLVKYNHFQEMKAIVMWTKATVIGIVRMRELLALCAMTCTAESGCTDTRPRPGFF